MELMMNAASFATTSRELVTQTRRWAVTMRGMTLGPWQGLMANSSHLQQSATGWFDMVNQAHDSMLEQWEMQAHATIDQVAKLTDNKGA